jgi:hypothetical protein
MVRIASGTWKIPDIRQYGSFEVQTQPAPDGQSGQTSGCALALALELKLEELFKKLCKLPIATLLTPKVILNQRLQLRASQQIALASGLSLERFWAGG